MKMLERIKDLAIDALDSIVSFLKRALFPFEWYSANKAFKLYKAMVNGEIEDVKRLASPFVSVHYIAERLEFDAINYPTYGHLRGVSLSIEPLYENLFTNRKLFKQYEYISLLFMYRCSSMSKNKFDSDELDILSKSDLRTYDIFLDKI